MLPRKDQNPAQNAWQRFRAQLVRVLAVVVLGVWFLLQVLGRGGLGVAWMAHTGGLATGLVLVRLFLPWRRPSGWGRVS